MGRGFILRLSPNPYRQIDSSADISIEILAGSSGSRRHRDTDIICGDFNSVRPETIVSLVHESGALDRARHLAQDYAQRAKACLNGHADSEFARALATLPDFILEREN